MLHRLKQEHSFAFTRESFFVEHALDDAMSRVVYHIHSDLLRHKTIDENAVVTHRVAIPASSRNRRKQRLADRLADPHGRWYLFDWAKRLWLRAFPVRRVEQDVHLAVSYRKYRAFPEAQVRYPDYLGPIRMHEEADVHVLNNAYRAL